MTPVKATHRRGRMMTAMIHALVAALLLAAPHPATSGPAPSAADVRAAQDAILAELVAGNARFVEEKQAPHALGAGRRQELARDGQHPRAVVLSCSDSRVPPEYVFDQQLGEVFVVRTAGNVAGSVALGSIEYAVEHLGVPVIVVLGHRSCGAVKAAVEAHEKHTELHGNVGEVVGMVMPAVTEAAKGRAPDLLDASIDANVARVARSLVRRSPLLAERVKAGKVKVVTAIYDLQTGKVDFSTAHR